LVAAENSNKAIGSKLGASDRARAVALAHRRGIIEL
jgi:hypothetical protein